MRSIGDLQIQHLCDLPPEKKILKEIKNPLQP